MLAAEGIPADPELLALTEPYHQATLRYIRQPIGQARCAYRGGLAARFGANPLAELLHQAQLQAVREAGLSAELSLVNICSSAGLAAGPIFLQDAYSLTVYDNTLCVLEITGDILRRALEQTAGYFRQLDPEHLPADPASVVAPEARGYTFDLYHGIDYCFDLTRPVGERLVTLQFRGQPVQPDQTFRLAINHYRAGGGGGATVCSKKPKPSGSPPTASATFSPATFTPIPPSSPSTATTGTSFPTWPRSTFPRAWASSRTACW